jgi:arylsulfatase A-like enzyme
MYQIIKAVLVVLSAVSVYANSAPAPGERRPNIILILADDLGYADLGCQGSREVFSPRIDSLAANGVRFTAGYVSAPQCCPSRAGLLTGRYQNRFGFEYNFGPADRGNGLSLKERTIADDLKAAGYVTGIVGKWHLGDAEGFRPYERGFQESLWHPGGGVYFPAPGTEGIPGLRRGREPVKLAGYSTDVFAREAAEFIARHRHEPFFLYLTFVAPHWPMAAKPEHLERFAQVKDLHRRTFLAMMAALDDGVGVVLDKLGETNLEEQTLVFFLSDNGGPTGAPRASIDAPFQYGQNTSLNVPLRGVKGDLLEGGIRVPFLARWKGHLPAGKVYDQPVISLDILPTALAAAGVSISADHKLDGTNLLPFIQGARSGITHETLYWRFNFPPKLANRHRWAIRQGDWKLVKNDVEPIALYNLAADVGETRNLAAQHPDRVTVLEAAWRRWNAEMAPPAWEGAASSARKRAN